MIKKFLRLSSDKKTKYEVRIGIIPEEKLIYWMDCECYDFTHRKLKRNLDFSDRQIIATPCKHLIDIIEYYKKQGFKLKEPKQMSGSDKCITKLKKKLFERSEGLCENCHQKLIKYAIHRLIRGSSGGKYSEKNCVILCPTCHKQIHNKEFSNI